MVITNVRMNNLLAERPDGTIADRTYTLLIKQESERCDAKMVIDGSSVFIKEEMYGEDFEDEFFSEDTNERAECHENGCLDKCAENVVKELVEDGVTEVSIKNEHNDEDERDLNGADGYILPDVKPRIDMAGMETAVATLNTPSLTEGDDTKVDGGTTAFCCEKTMNITSDKRRRKRAKYADIRAKETTEAIEALKKGFHREKNFACDMCGNLFKSRRTLIRHIGCIHCDEKKYHCETCGKGFLYISHLALHAKSHSVEKKHVCKKCGRGFKVSFRLERHMFTHSQDKPFKCSICGASFSQNSYLQVHAAIHTGERNYGCATCGMNFVNRSNLRRHFLSHTSKKPYKCSICNQRFKFLNSITKHKKVFHKMISPP